MNSASLICPCCARPIKNNDDFCPSCGVPLTTHATTDPILLIRAGGAETRCTKKVATPLVVIGDCLLFGLPFVLALLGVAFSLIHIVQGTTKTIEDFVGLVLSGFFVWLFYIIMQKKSHGYWTTKENKRDEEKRGRRQRGQARLS